MFTVDRTAFRTHAILYVTLHLRDRRSASLCYRNRSEITILMHEQTPYPVWFKCWRNWSYPAGIVWTYPYLCNSVVKVFEHENAQEIVMKQIARYSVSFLHNAL